MTFVDEIRLAILVKIRASEQTAAFAIPFGIVPNRQVSVMIDTSFYYLINSALFPGMCLTWDGNVAKFTPSPVTLGQFAPRLWAFKGSQSVYSIGCMSRGAGNYAGLIENETVSYISGNFKKSYNGENLVFFNSLSPWFVRDLGITSGFLAGCCLLREVEADGPDDTLSISLDPSQLFGAIGTSGLSFLQFMQLQKTAIKV